MCNHTRCRHRRREIPRGSDGTYSDVTHCVGALLVHTHRHKSKRKNLIHSHNRTNVRRQLCVTVVPNVRSENRSTFHLKNNKKTESPTHLSEGKQLRLFLGRLLYRRLSLAGRRLATTAQEFQHIHSVCAAHDRLRDNLCRKMPRGKGLHTRNAEHTEHTKTAAAAALLSNRLIPNYGVYICAAQFAGDVVQNREHSHALRKTDHVHVQRIRNNKKELQRRLTLYTSNTIEITVRTRGCRCRQ